MNSLVEDQVQALATMSPARLRAEWQRVFRKTPPLLSTDLLRRAIAWRLQEKVAQGPVAAVERELVTIAAQQPGADPIGPRREGMRPGTQLVRSWRGKTFTVLATETGFRFEERDYDSLTAIAREITGAAWSGPRFFGLRSPRRSRKG
jgi:hypothetical protein